MPPALEVQSLNHWTTREVWSNIFNSCNSLVRPPYVLPGSA